MFPQLTDEFAAQRRQAYRASADRRRFGRRARAARREPVGASAVFGAHVVALAAPCTEITRRVA